MPDVELDPSSPALNPDPLAGSAPAHDPGLIDYLAGEKLQFGSFAVVKQVATERSARLLVWPDEGLINLGGRWRFHDEIREHSPLVLDMQTANLMLEVFAALQGPKNRAKFERMLAQSRLQFSRIVDFCWRSAG